MESILENYVTSCKRSKQSWEPGCHYPFPGSHSWWSPWERVAAMPAFASISSLQPCHRARCGTRVLFRLSQPHHLEAFGYFPFNIKTPFPTSTSQLLRLLPEPPFPAGELMFPEAQHCAHSSLLLTIYSFLFRCPGPLHNINNSCVLKTIQNKWVSEPALLSDL